MIKKIKKKKQKIFFIALCIFYLYLSFYSRARMWNLPKGEYISSLDSPNGKYVLNAYRYSGGATMDWSLRVELENKETKLKTNIYWVYHESDAKMQWIDNQTVKINETKLNIHKEYRFN